MQRTERKWCWVQTGMDARAVAPLRDDLCALEIVPVEGGSTNLAVELAALHPHRQIGVVVAGNSGRPGGACGHMDRNGRPYVTGLKHTHRTQEEDVVANWLLSHRNVEGTNPNALFANTIGGKRRWGMTHPSACREGDRLYATLQKRDYRQAAPADYRDAWHVTNCIVCKKTAAGYDHAQRTRCSLVFVAGPQATAGHTLRPPRTQGDYTCTQYRTFNAAAAAEYDHFLAAVAETFYAALQAMAAMGDTIAVLCHVSGGIYAGPWRATYGDGSDLTELTEVVNKVLERTVHGVPLGRYFERVVFAKHLPCKNLGT